MDGSRIDLWSTKQLVLRFPGFLKLKIHLKAEVISTFPAYLIFFG